MDETERLRDVLKKLGDATVTHVNDQLSAEPFTGTGHEAAEWVGEYGVIDARLIHDRVEIATTGFFGKRWITEFRVIEEE